MRQPRGTVSDIQKEQTCSFLESLHRGRYRRRRVLVSWVCRSSSTRFFPFFRNRRIQCFELTWWHGIGSLMASFKRTVQMSDDRALKGDHFNSFEWKQFIRIDLDHQIWWKKLPGFWKEWIVKHFKNKGLDSIMLRTRFGHIYYNDSLVISQIPTDGTEWPNRWPDWWPDHWPGRATKNCMECVILRGIIYLYWYLFPFLKNVAPLIAAVIRPLLLYGWNNIHC